MASLAGAITGQYTDLALAFATVTAFNPATRALTVDIDGGAVPNVGYLDTYAPTVGHVVTVLRVGNTALCLGRVRGISG